MAEQNLLEQIQELRGALEKASDLDTEKSYLVGGLLSEIVERATSAEQGEVSAEKYSDTLRNQVSHFEADHPKIAGLIEGLATMLSSLGI